MNRLGLRSVGLQGACPLCAALYSTTLGAAINERIVHCANGHAIQLKDEHGSGRRSVNRVERDFAKLERTMRRIGRRR